MKKQNILDLYATLDTRDSIAQQNSSEDGLSSNDAKRRLKKFGENVYFKEQSIPIFRIFFNQFKSPLIMVLLFAIAISFYLGELVDAYAIAIIVALNAIIGFIQEYSAEKTIKSLSKLVPYHAKVMRDSKIMQINPKFLVPGDIVLVGAEDKVPADCRVMVADNLKVDESILTGESVSAYKTHDKLTEQYLKHEHFSLSAYSNILYSGTTIVNGEAKLLVVKTGLQSEIGKIAEFTKAPKSRTHLEKKLDVFTIRLTKYILAFTLMIFIVSILHQSSFADAFIFAIALAVAVIPEGLPVVITLNLSIALRRLARKKALMRSLPSIETLGSVDIICTDKTGTLTLNKLTVDKIYYFDSAKDAALGQLKK